MTEYCQIKVSEVSYWCKNTLMLSSDPKVQLISPSCFLIHFSRLQYGSGSNPTTGLNFLSVLFSLSPIDAKELKRGIVLASSVLSNFVSGLFLCNYFQHFNETLWKLSILLKNVHILGMFWFDPSTYSHGL